MTVVSGNIRFMGIFTGVPRKGDIKRQWGCRKQQFSVLSLISSEALEIRPTLLYIPSTGVTLYWRVTLNKKSNNDMFYNFHYYEERYSENNFTYFKVIP